MKRVTIRDVAELADVSNATVSAVLNERGTVKESTRKLVLDVVEQLGYQPTGSMRRALQTSSLETIGLVVKEIDNPYFADVYQGARRVAEKRGYTLLIASSESDYRSEHRIVDLLAWKDIGGLIINPLLEDQADLSHLFELKRRNIPFVLLESILGLQASIVDVDNAAASKAAVDYLIGLGHERIVHFAGPRTSMHSQERIEGFRRAFSESDLVFRDDAVVYAGSHLDDGYHRGLAYFRAAGDDRPTAVTCYNDLVAIGLMKALRELQLRVPADVSIVGYDDIAMLDYLTVPLTTIRVPKFDMGVRAADLLIHRIESPPAGDASRTVERVILPAELVVRASTAPPSKAEKR